MPVTKIAKVTFTSSDQVRDVIHNFNADGFGSLYPKYKGGRPKTFTLPDGRSLDLAQHPDRAHHVGSAAPHAHSRHLGQTAGV